MKIINLLLLFAIFTTFACETDENLEPQGPNNVTQPFDGEWSLRTISCECEPLFLNMGDDIWTFDSESNSLSIVNYVSAVYPDLDSTGVKTIAYTEDSIFFDEVGYLYYFIEEDLFLADYPEADGPLIQLLPYVPLENIDCCNLHDGLINRNDSLLGLEINSLCEDLNPYYNFTDDIGHFGNLHSLINRLNEDCSDIEVSIDCYACIETFPALSEISFELDSSGTMVSRLVDITTPNDDILSYAGVH